MNLKALLVVVICLGSYQTTAQKSEKIKTEISQVRVYLTGAEIVREKKLNISAGKTLYEFEGLSPMMDPNTAKIRTSPGIRILSITTDAYYLASEQLEPEIAKVKDSLDQSTDKWQLLRDEELAHTAEKTMLTENQRLGGTTGISVDALKNGTQFYFEKHFQINKRLSELKKLIAGEYQEMNRLQLRLNNLNYSNNNKRHSLKVLIESPSAVTETISISYIVARTGWEPVYDILAENISSPITLKYKAKVFNNTAIPWDNVKLFLSSADPYLSAEQPTLDPWYLNFENYESFKNKSRGNSTAAYNQMQSTSWSNMPGTANVVAVKEVLVPDVAADFDIPEKYTIPANSKPYLVGISETQLKADYQHMAVPVIEKTAFLMARVTGWEELNLIEGPANIYFANKYVGKSKLNTFEFDDTLSISLGRDNKVLLEREEKREYKSRSLIGNQRKENYVYGIKVKNLHNKEVRIKVIDQYPISQNSEISVDVVKISNADQNEQTGILTWDLRIAPSGTTELELSYTIKSPKGKKVVTKQTFRTISAPSF